LEKQETATEVYEEVQERWSTANDALVTATNAEAAHQQAKDEFDEAW
jgi:hypothetical protein